jgi:hypothetical protein
MKTIIISELDGKLVISADSPIPGGVPVFQADPTIEEAELRQFLTEKLSELRIFHLTNIPSYSYNEPFSVGGDDRHLIYNQGIHRHGRHIKHIYRENMTYYIGGFPEGGERCTDEECADAIILLYKSGSVKIWGAELKVRQTLAEEGGRYTYMVACDILEEYWWLSSFAERKKEVERVLFQHGCNKTTTQEAISEAVDYYKNYYERENGVTKEIAEIINS